MALADEFEKEIWSEISENDGLKNILKGVRDETKRRIARILQSKETKKQNSNEEYAEILTDIFCDVIGKVRQERKKKVIKTGMGMKCIVYRIALNYLKSKE